MKLVLTIILTLILLLTGGSVVSAETGSVSSSAQLVSFRKNNKVDLRIYRLEKFFRKYNSPLAEHSEDFIFWADTYHIDWRLVPAISGVESTFGQKIPHQSFNAYGWANGNYSFHSWEESIKKVSLTIREKYYNKGATNINKIARRYAPPSSTWSGKVKYFMKKIDSVPVEFDL